MSENRNKIVEGKSLSEAFPISTAKPLQDGQILYLPTLRVIREDANRIYLKDIGENNPTYYYTPRWFAEKLARLLANGHNHVKIVRGKVSRGGRVITTINCVICDAQGNIIAPTETL